MQALMRLPLWIVASYNRAKSADAAFSIAHWVFLGCSGVVAWASSTWTWYWGTYSWAGVAFAFLVSWVVLAFGFFLSGIGARAWRGRTLIPSEDQEAKNDQPGMGSVYVSDITIAYELMPTTEPVQFIGKATRNEPRLRIVVEHSYYATWLGGAGWYDPRHVELDDLKDVIAGRQIVIPIVRGSSRPGELPGLKWGNADGPPVNIIQQGKYKARIRILGTDNEQAPLNFVLICTSSSAPYMVTVIMESDFTFRELKT